GRPLRRVPHRPPRPPGMGPATPWRAGGMSPIQSETSSHGRPRAAPSGDFDFAVYALVKPLFLQTATPFAAFPLDVKSFSRQLMAGLQEKFGLSRDALQRMRPYLEQFTQEAKDGKLDFGNGSPLDAQDVAAAVGIFGSTRSLLDSLIAEARLYRTSAE